MSNLTIRILTELLEENWFSFHQIYAPLLSEKAKNLYINFYYQQSINERLNIHAYSFKSFLKNSKIKEEEFEEVFQELNELGLAKKKIKSNINTASEVLIKLKRALDIKEALKIEKIKGKLKATLTKEKFSELKLITEEVEEFEEEPIVEKEVLNKDIYCEFYNGVFKRLNEEFSVNDETLSLIKEYEKVITMEEFQNFAYQAIKELDGKYHISHNHFQFLIEQKINNNSDEKFDSFQYDLFWKGLLDNPDSKSKKIFKSLFSKYDCETLYKKLTNKPKTPIGLNKWIRDCIQNKNFSFPIINATMSFVKTLLHKIPVNYLIKLSDTLYENNATDFESFISHIKDVISHDADNKDRLNIKNKKKSFMFHY
ncbi:helicase DnaB [Candidatus Mycoplasma haematobovis]|uniref:Helicase DnaB n=1 Tax=Candidatus Mycoplasma haematobovis TaxID=432608 RepID=A0A1A9QEY6_9MOLU|nr:helicase DnaB [Candidatus Mycoplasma haematobovis]OAL10269.1 helicase DnaB [Candidatus Mycoplasma haematobovis]